MTTPQEKHRQSNAYLGLYIDDPTADALDRAMAMRDRCRGKPVTKSAFVREILRSALKEYYLSFDL